LRDGGKGEGCMEDVRDTGGSRTWAGCGKSMTQVIQTNRPSKIHLLIGTPFRTDVAFIKYYHLVHHLNLVEFIFLINR
jgi:hypothetical protein